MTTTDTTLTAFLRAATCSRCAKRFRRARDPEAWNLVFDRGLVIGVLCSHCQSPEENAEAEINAATLDYGVNAFGFPTSAPKAATND